jgi:hypothetical protein
MSLFVPLLEFNRFPNVNYWLTASSNAYQFQTTGSALQKQSNDAMGRASWDGEVQKLLGAVETSTHTGLRDRALLGTLAYTFARIGAVVNLEGRRLLSFRETVNLPVPGSIWVELAKSNRTAGNFTSRWNDRDRDRAVGVDPVPLNELQ